MGSAFTNQEIVAAYQRTGSVWRAGKELGLSGQSVHERLRSFGYPLGSRMWTEDEISELESLVGHMTIGQIANRLGRPYAGVAGKISHMGIGVRFGNQMKAKIPRGAGYDKASCTKYIKQIDAADIPVSRFAKQQGLGVEMLCQTLQKHFPEWWDNYRRTHSDLPERTCSYCQRTFVPSNGKQEYCSRKCGADRRIDDNYFSGNRRSTVGLLEGICQLCGRVTAKGLTPHHVIGKENDPTDQILIALCRGCHQAVTILAGRSFLDTTEGWESLIALVAMRRGGGERYGHGTYVYVELEELSEEEIEEMQAEGATA